MESSRSRLLGFDEAASAFPIATQKQTKRIFSAKIRGRPIQSNEAGITAQGDRAIEAKVEPMKSKNQAIVLKIERRRPVRARFAWFFRNIADTTFRRVT